MKLNEYLEHLSKLLPSEELMRNAGFTSLPFDIRKGYILDKRIDDTKAKSVGLIFELFQESDPQYLRFADFTFYEKKWKVRFCWQFLL